MQPYPINYPIKLDNTGMEVIVGEGGGVGVNNPIARQKVVSEINYTPHQVNTIGLGGNRNSCGGVVWESKCEREKHVAVPLWAQFFTEQVRNDGV